jgi:hypothetical protein
MSGALQSIKTKGSAALDKAKNAVGIETKSSNPNLTEEISEMCPKLTYQQRMIGFGTCFVVGE